MNEDGYEGGPLRGVTEAKGKAGNRVGKCPNCGTVGIIDVEQYQGIKSIDCPTCPYAETHDHRDTAPGE